jgi:hypothetical protein
MSTLRVCLLGLALASLSACFPKIGNDLNGTCERGEACVCDLIGNCSRSCPDGGCTFECRGTSNCLFSCEGGGCNTICENTGNCITECSGGNCTKECNNTGNCIVDEGRDLSSPPPRDMAVVVPQDLTSHD